MLEERDLDELDAGMVVKRTSKGDRDGVKKMQSVNSSDGLCRNCVRPEIQILPKHRAGIEGSRRDEIATMLCS